MSRDELAEAAEILEQAAEDAEAAEAAGGEAAETLRSQAAQLAALADRDRGPDHGRLDRHQQTLKRLKPDVDGAIADRIDEANELLTTYRQTLPGV